MAAPAFPPFHLTPFARSKRMPTQAPNIFLNINIERAGETSIVHCSGTLVSGACSYLHKEVYPLIAESKRIEVEMADVQWIDSMGLGALVRLHVVAKKNGCVFALTRVAPRVMDMLKLTNLLLVFGEVGEKGEV
jgi:anti-sigma B factor antagonist